MVILDGIFDSLAPTAVQCQWPALPSTILIGAKYRRSGRNSWQFEGGVASTTVLSRLGLFAPEPYLPLSTTPWQGTRLHIP